MSKTKKVALLIIDPQNDFHEGGALAVTGATDDSTRIAELIKSKGNELDQIYVTLDTHHRLHIAHAVFWKNDQGENPPPFTLIKNEDVKNRKWFPNDEKMYEWCLEYTEQLEKGGRLVLCIWPEHCLIGTPGHAVQGPLNAALQEWSLITRKPIEYVLKGQNLRTEMYSALKADVVINDDPSTGMNTALIEKLRQCDSILIGGEAKSHCVNYTVRDLVAELEAREEDLKKVVILEDGCSNVAGFEDQGAQFLEDMKGKGCYAMNIADTDIFFTEDVVETVGKSGCRSCSVM